MRTPTQIVEMDQERDRKTCLSLDLKVTGANRELAQWLLDHPRYSAPVVAGWLGGSDSRIKRLRAWAKGGFEGLPNDSAHRNFPDRSTRRDAPLETHDNSDSDEYVPPDIDHPPRGAEWEKDPEDQDPKEPRSKTNGARAAGDSEVASPEVLEDNMLHVLGGMNENARIFNKFFKISAFDREAAKRIVTAIDKTIGKLRSIQTTLSQE